MPHLVPVFLHCQGLGTSWSVTHNHLSPSTAHRPLSSETGGKGKRTGKRKKRCITACGFTPNTTASKSWILEWHLSHWHTVWVHSEALASTAPEGHRGMEDRYPSQTGLHARSCWSARNYLLQLQAAGADPGICSAAAGQSTGAAAMSEVMNSRDGPMKKIWEEWLSNFTAHTLPSGVQWASLTEGTSEPCILVLGLLLAVSFSGKSDLTSTWYNCVKAADKNYLKATYTSS